MFTLTAEHQHKLVYDVFTLLPGEHPTLEAWATESEHVMKLN